MSDINDIFRRIYQRVVETAKAEDDALWHFKEGIFFVPEHAFAYLAGKYIMNNASDTFGTPNVRWRRELTVGDDGPSDLVFECDSVRYVIEFKMVSTLSACKGDVNKLLNLQNVIDDLATERVFIALMDAFTDEVETDARFKGIDGLACTERLCGSDKFKSFSTIQHRYQKPVSCLVTGWRIRECEESSNKDCAISCKRSTAAL